MKENTARKQERYTLCLKKVPTFLLSVTLSNLIRFWKFCTAGKRTKCATKRMWHYAPHFWHVATLPWETKNSNFLQMWKKTQTKCIFSSPLTLLFIH